MSEVTLLVSAQLAFKWRPLVYMESCSNPCPMSCTAGRVGQRVLSTEICIAGFTAAGDRHFSEHIRRQIFVSKVGYEWYSSLRKNKNYTISREILDDVFCWKWTVGDTEKVDEAETEQWKQRSRGEMFLLTLGIEGHKFFNEMRLKNKNYFVISSLFK